jgi:hypothetical protein
MSRLQIQTVTGASYTLVGEKVYSGSHANKNFLIGVLAGTYSGDSRRVDGVHEGDGFVVNPCGLGKLVAKGLVDFGSEAKPFDCMVIRLPQNSTHKITGTITKISTPGKRS